LKTARAAWEKDGTELGNTSDIVPLFISIWIVFQYEYGRR